MPVVVTWLGHASVMIKNGPAVFYIDPWKTGKGLPQGDIILLTHDHYDHYSEKDIAALSNKSTQVIAPMRTPPVTDQVRPGDRRSFAQAAIEAVPAYNTDKSFHPKANGWVGYIVEAGGQRIYHTGDTDRIPEMKGLKNIDLALIPVGGTFTMNAEQAAEAVKDIGAREVIPIHFGDIVGSREDAEELSRIALANVHILNPGESFELI